MSADAISLIAWLLLVALYVVVRVGVACEQRAAVKRIERSNAINTTGTER